MPTWIGISWKWANMLTELAGDGECRLALFHVIRNFLANEIYHFSRLSHQTGCIFTWGALYIESTPYSATSACSRRLFWKTFWSLGFEIFSSFFLRMQFLWVATSFPLVLVICLSWYLQLKLSREFLTLVSFTFGDNISHLELFSWHFRSQIVQKDDLSAKSGDFFQISYFLKLRGLLVTVDIQKAFDSVNHLFDWPY